MKCATLVLLEEHLAVKGLKLLIYANEGKNCDPLQVQFKYRQESINKNGKLLNVNSRLG